MYNYWLFLAGFMCGETKLCLHLMSGLLENAQLHTVGPLHGATWHLG